jgi:heat shock protein HslJ
MRHFIFFIGTFFFLVSCQKESNPANLLITSTVVSNSDLRNKKWLLTQLNSKTIEGDANSYYIKFDSKEDQFSAKAGCNTLFGSFQLGENTKIAFSNVGATKMYCMNMEVENQFIQLLEKTTQIKINQQVLIFLSDNSKALASFSLVEN